MQQAMLVRCHQATLLDALGAGSSSWLHCYAFELIPGALSFTGYVRQTKRLLHVSLTASLSLGVLATICSGCLCLG